LLASAVAAPATNLGAVTEPVRTAMIGVGHRGTALTKQVLAQKDVRIVAICDIDAAARDAAQSLAKRDNPRSYDDYRKVLDLSDVDAVVVATPCDLHSEMTVAAMAAGKHIYCEKPIGVTPEQVAGALKAVRGAKTVFQIGQQLRYYPALRELMRQLHERKVVGRIFAIKAQRHSSFPKKPRKRPAWYLDVKRSGDLIVENAVHNIDVINWMVGDHPLSACGDGRTYLPRITPAGERMLDGYSVTYLHENGVHVDFSQFRFHPPGMKRPPNGQWYAVYGEKGGVEAGHSGGTFHDLYGAEGEIELVSPEVQKAKEDAMGKFYAAIRGGPKPLAGIEVAATAALTAIMGREAIYQKRVITWKELGVEV